MLNSEKTIPARDESHVKFGGWEFRILWTVGLLLGFGLIMIFDLGYYSTSSAMTSSYLMNILKFAFSAIAGILLIIAIRGMRSGSLFWFGNILLYIAVALLIVTWKVGVEVHGARRWIDIFGFRFQPVELFKVAIAISLASFLTKGHTSKVAAWFVVLAKILFIPSMIVGLLFVYIQPNHSAVITIGIVTFLILSVSTIRKGYVAILVVIMTVIIALLIMQDPEKMARIAAFINRDDPESSFSISEERFQVERAVEVIRMSGWWGMGIGHSIYKYSIPAASTDFIFCIIIEEFGFVGGTLLLLCYLYFAFCALNIATGENNKFMKLACIGATLSLILNVLIHAAVNLDLAPTTGVNLPFISQGGSALLFNLVAVGLVLNVAHRRDNQITE